MTFYEFYKILEEFIVLLTMPQLIDEPESESE